MNSEEVARFAELLDFLHDLNVDKSPHFAYTGNKEEIR